MDTASPTEQRIQTVCLAVLSTVAVGAALYWLSPVLIPFVLAVFLSYCLSPVIEVQMRFLRIPRPMAILVTVIVGCVVLFSLGMVISRSVGEMSANSGAYQTRIIELLDWFAASIPFERFGLEIEDITNSFVSFTQAAVTGMLTGTASGIMTILSNGIMVMIFMVFMLIGTKANEESSGGILAEVEASIKKYLLAMVFLSGLTGVLVGVTLTFLGVEFAWMFGFLAFLLNFIPNIGSMIATLLPLPVVLLSPDLGITAKIVALSIPGLIQFTIGNLVQPRMMGDSLDLHPVAVLMSLIFFGMIWGVVGMFLATPITAVTKILLEKGQFTAPVANLLAGRLDALMSPPS